MDALSRAPVAAAVTIPQSTDEFATAQRSDPELRLLFDYLESNTLPSDDKQAATIRSISTDYIVQDGRLWPISTPVLSARRTRREPLEQHLVVPASLRADILRECHDSSLAGHFGVARTFENVRRRYHWQGMYADVQNWVQSCLRCASRKSARQAPAGQLQPIAVGDAWETVGVDILGPLHRSESGKQFIIVFSDYLTKWSEAFAMEKADAATVARLLFDEIICRYGAPRRLLSDRGSVFRAAILSELCEIFKIKKVFTIAYHPQTDGLVERFNHTLATMLSTFVSENQSDWDQYLQPVMYAYRRSLHDTTQDTPFFLMFGRDAPSPADVANGVTLRTDGPVDLIEWRSRLVTTIRDAHAKATAAIQQRQLQQKDEYDQRHRPQHFNVGEQVMRYNPAVKKGLSAKLSSLWHGPYRIIERCGEQLYKLAQLDGKVLSDMTHVQRLKHYEPRVGFNEDPPPTPSEPPEVDIPQDKYEVEAILAQRRNQGHSEYLVKWKDYDESFNSWVDRRDMDCPDLLKAFNSKKVATSRSRRGTGSH